MRIEERNALLHHHLLECIEVEEVEAAGRLDTRKLSHTMLTYDDHRLALTCRDEIVHDVTHHSLSRPACLILTCAMHEVKHRETALRLGDILRRKVNIALPDSSCQL